MIDFHTHIIPQIDDGSRGVEETFNIIREAEEVGFNKIISTSHYLIDKYEAKEEERKVLLNAIEKKTNESIGSIELYLGSEIYVDMNIVNFLKEKKASTINNSRYVLFELPMKRKFLEIKEVIYKLIENRYIPIIAHPERYVFVQQNPNKLIDFIEMGVLFQANYGSFIGIYGNEAKKTVKKLIKNDMIHFLGSDVHKQNSIYPQIPKCIKKIKKIISERKFEKLSSLNPECVLNNEQIDIRRPKKI